RLCEESCPFNAIQKSTVPAPATERTIAADKRRLAVLIVLLPLLVATGVWFGSRSGASMARRHRVVSLAERIYLEEIGAAQGTTDASAAFRATGEPLEKLYAEAKAVRQRFVLAGGWCGAWIALVIGVKLISLSVRRHRRDYEADPIRCVGCARCFRYCPEELRRLGLPVPEPAQLSAQGTAAPGVS
ncbi:MAG: hypothetical protein N3B01_02800, partial [Verrucomicrobiae bacterium]|nr:hypothetical protein [Verrucomicrobiae bacterium]